MMRLIPIMYVFPTAEVVNAFRGGVILPEKKVTKIF